MSISSYHVYYKVHTFVFEGREYNVFTLPSGEAVCVSTPSMQDWIAKHPGMMLENALVLMTQHKPRICVEDNEATPHHPS